MWGSEEWGAGEGVSVCVCGREGSACVCGSVEWVGCVMGVCE